MHANIQADIIIIIFIGCPLSASYDNFVWIVIFSLLFKIETLFFAFKKKKSSKPNPLVQVWLKP